jgi:hypothetical protein
MIRIIRDFIITFRFKKYSHTMQREDTIGYQKEEFKEIIKWLKNAIRSYNSVCLTGK